MTADADLPAEVPQPSVRELLAAAVAGVGGTERPGQVQMAEAVDGRHDRRQPPAGPGRHRHRQVAGLPGAGARCTATRVVVATATIALQNQVVDRDLPALVDAVEPLLGRRPTYAILKGRSNYLCRNKVLRRDAGRRRRRAVRPVADHGAGPATWCGCGAGPRRPRPATATSSTPASTDRAWRQVSVTARECLGAAKCPYGEECFAELARNRAAEVEIVVTNHALLAIDALESFAVLPEHDAVVVDEAHELVDRVTGVATDELTAPMVERAAAAGPAARRRHRGPRRRRRRARGGAGRRCPRAGSSSCPSSWRPRWPLVRDAARDVLVRDRPRPSTPTTGRARSRVAMVDAVHETAERVAAALAVRRHAGSRTTQRRGSVLKVAPLSVNGLLREALFGDRTVVLTSATLELGGVVRAGGPAGRADRRRRPGVDRARRRLAVRLPDARASSTSPGTCPRRGGTAPSPAAMDELAALVQAAGGRTLGLFSSMRAAEAAAAEMRERLDVPVLCQGEERTAALVAAFAADQPTCLFGTLSLWQGVDVPGDACRLVVIDRIPFPRPGRPADVGPRPGGGRRRRQRLHDGVGRARRAAAGPGRRPADPRAPSDRGVVAVLDSRLATARYGGFLRTSLPPFWFTTDHEVAVGALRRLDAR